MQLYLLSSEFISFLIVDSNFIKLHDDVIHFTLTRQNDFPITVDCFAAQSILQYFRLILFQ